jgi:formyltetrahydrofolate deformylase
MSTPLPTYILTLACPDRMGIVYNVSAFLLERGGNIIDSAQFNDPETGLFFMRVLFSISRPEVGLAVLRDEFRKLGEEFGMHWKIHDAAVKPKVMILVSQHGHCLNDLLYRYRAGTLRMEIPAIVSNHMDFYQLAASYNIPFFHLPVNKENKAHQEEKMMEMVREKEIDLVVLARYMQILSAQACAELRGRAINIHHSFLPSFKGAKPYFQAHARGVKLIGATAHYVTAELDEGPIIEQDVARVDHTLSAEEMTAVGRDVECVVLARAVRWHVERRVLMNGHKTVVFR